MSRARGLRLDGAVDVGLTALGDVREDRAVVRVEHLERGTVDRIDELAVDEQLVAVGHL